LKTSWSGHIIIRSIIALSLLLLLAAAGCGDDPTDEDINETSALAIDGIIVTPKAPAPGDTVRLTVVVSSSSLNIGDLPSYSWSITGGDLLESNKALVRWKAEAPSQIYSVTVTVSNSINSVSHTEPIFVTNSTDLLNNNSGEIHLLPGTDAFYYLYSDISAESQSFTGFTIARYDMGAVQMITTGLPGYNYQFSGDFSFAAHSYELFSELDAENAIDIIVDELPSGAQTQISKDESASNNRRRNQYTNPSISPDNKLIAFQAFKAAIALPEQGGVDTFDVHVYNAGTMETRRIRSHNKDFFPSFSSDGQYLTVISNRNGLTGWELFGFPVVGGVVDTASASVVRLSNTGELVTTSSPPSKPLSLWNPSASHPFLAIVSGDGKLRLVGTDGTSDIVSGISGLVTSLAWSNNGTKLAVCAGNELYSVGLDRTAQLIHSSAGGDMLADPSWIDNDNMIMYRIQRLASTWFEVVNVSGAVSLSTALKVTPKYAAQGIADYRKVSSMRPVWKSNSEIYALQFYSATPGVLKLNLSGIYN
jgi:hypothetical protein